jgi:pyridoxal 5'-phosphate synthase pdxT subunit
MPGPEYDVSKAVAGGKVARAAGHVCVLGADNGRIIAVRQGVLLATAFHPELTPDRRIHEFFVSMVKGTS